MEFNLSDKLFERTNNDSSEVISIGDIKEFVIELKKLVNSWNFPHEESKKIFLYELDKLAGEKLK